MYGMIRPTLSALVLARTVTRRVARSLGELLSPPRCAACDERLRRSASFCAACASQVELDERSCSVELRSSVSIEACAGAVYGGPLSSAIHALKYQRRSDLAGLLSPLAVRALFRLASKPDLLVPVPLHRERLLERGYDQAALLASALSDSAGLPWIPRVLERTRATPQQAKLDRHARLHNVHGAFTASRARSVLGRHVALVDDVLTTGATVGECAQVLLDAGASRVSVLVLARALDVDDGAEARPHERGVHSIGVSCAPQVAANELLLGPR
jgi:ComF family protein